MKLKSSWEQIIEKYSHEFPESDIVDLQSGKIIEDKGHLRGTPIREFGEDLDASSSEELSDDLLEDEDAFENLLDDKTPVKLNNLKNNSSIPLSFQKLRTLPESPLITIESRKNAVYWHPGKDEPMFRPKTKSQKTGNKANIMLPSKNLKERPPYQDNSKPHISLDYTAMHAIRHVEDFSQERKNIIRSKKSHLKRSLSPEIHQREVEERSRVRLPLRSKYPTSPHRISDISILSSSHKNIHDLNLLDEFHMTKPSTTFRINDYSPHSESIKAYNNSAYVQSKFPNSDYIDTESPTKRFAPSLFNIKDGHCNSQQTKYSIQNRYTQKGFDMANYRSSSKYILQQPRLLNQLTPYIPSPTRGVPFANSIYKPKKTQVIYVDNENDIEKHRVLTSISPAPAERLIASPFFSTYPLDSREREIKREILYVRNNAEIDQQRLYTPSPKRIRHYPQLEPKRDLNLTPLHFARTRRAMVGKQYDRSVLGIKQEQRESCMSTGKIVRSRLIDQREFERNIVQRTFHNIKEAQAKLV